MFFKMQPPHFGVPLPLFRHTPYNNLLFFMLNFKSFGQGQPLIILHGLFGSLDNWQSFAKELSKDYWVFTLDLRDHGKSPHTEAFDYSLAANDVVAFMEAQWMFQAHIIGHSMGGKVAMQLAFDHPHLVQSLSVLDIAPKRYKGGHERFFRAMSSLDLSSLNSRSEANDLLAVQVPEDGIRQFLLKNLDRKKEGGFAWKFNLPLLHAAYPAIMDELQGVPYTGSTLFVRGGQSDYITDEDWPNILSLFPNARLETIPRAGHWLHADAPSELLELLRSFLAES
jgi:esterase